MTFFGFFPVWFLMVISAHSQFSYECVHMIIEADEKWGAVRNEDCRSMPMSDAIEKYLLQLKQMDYTGCPEEFIKAFHAHLDAWEDMIPVVEKYEEKRGEMHDLFEIMKTTEHSREFNNKLQAIWESWAIVEAIVDKHK